MSDTAGEVISGADLQEFGAAYSRIAGALTLEVRRQLGAVFKSYFVAYGLDGVHARFNGRTVTQILAEYQSPEIPPALAAGEVDGVRYALYEALPQEAAEQVAIPDRGGK